MDSKFKIYQSNIRTLPTPPTPSWPTSKPPLYIHSQDKEAIFQSNWWQQQQGMIWQRKIKGKTQTGKFQRLSNGDVSKAVSWRSSLMVPEIHSKDVSIQHLLGTKHTFTSPVDKMQNKILLVQRRLHCIDFFFRFFRNCGDFPRFLRIFKQQINSPGNQILQE